MEENPDGRYKIMKKGVDYNTAKKFREMDEDNENYPNIKGIWLEEDYIRKYPYDTLACDVIGFTGSDNQGILGLEVKYNQELGKNLDLNQLEKEYCIKISSLNKQRGYKFLI